MNTVFLVIEIYDDRLSEVVKVFATSEAAELFAEKLRVDTAYFNVDVVEMEVE